VLSASVPSQGTDLAVPFVFRWQDSFVLKAGAEVCWDRFRWGRGFTTRIGYAFGGQASNRGYPDAFPAPPRPPHYLTGGAGFGRGRYQVNLAVVYQLAASTFIDAREIAGTDECPFCGKQGTYSSSGVAAMVDFSARLGKVDDR